MQNSSLTLHTDTQETTPVVNTSMSLRSGAGAPIFEPGPHTRIRRNPVRAFASFSWPGGPREVFGQVLNISLTGCLLMTESTIEDGTHLDITITILGKGDPVPVEVCAAIRRQTQVNGRRAYGLQFVASSSLEKQAIQALYSQAAR